MQFSEKSGALHRSTKSFKLGLFGKAFLLMVIALAAFLLLFYLMFNVVFFRATPELFIFLVFILQVLSIIACTVSLSRDLYMSKDNMILMSYPVKHIEIFISKLIVAYLVELKKSFTMTLPLFIAFGVIANSFMSVNYVLGAIFYTLLLPLIPVLIGSLLSIPFVYLGRAIRKAGWVKGLFTLIIFAGLIVLCILYTNWLNEIGEIRLLALWNRFQKGFTAFLGTVNRFALYNNFVGYSMLGSSALDIFLNYLFFILVLIGLIAIIIVTALPTYYHLSSLANEKSSSKAHKGKNKAHKSTFFTFFRKEVTLAVRNLSNFASDYIFLFIMPIVLILLTTTFAHINRNSLGYSLTYGFIALITLILLAASNTASATAISSEGNEFVLLKTAPGDTKNIIWSKLLLNFFIAFIATLISYILLTVFLQKEVESGRINIGIVWAIFALAVFIESGELLTAIQYDILNPRLREYANSENKNEIKNSGRSVLNGIVMAIVGTAIIFLSVLIIIPSLIDGFGETNAILITIGGISLFGIIYLLVKFYFLVQYRNAYFEEIEL